MFAVEISIGDDDALADTMGSMRIWLDHRRFEPTLFRYNFGVPGCVLHIEFPLEAEAAQFAAAFGGHVVSPAAARPTVERRSGLSPNE